MKQITAWAALVLTVTAGAGWRAVAQSPTPAADVGAQGAPMRARTGFGEGYFPGGSLPDSLRWSPPPPARGSIAERRDVDAAQRAVAARNGPRWQLAIRDADLGPQATDAFSCAAGLDIGPDTTPKLDHLLRKAAANLGRSTAAIKDEYKRPRPFMVNREPTCTPQAEQYLRADGSYPSGHSAIGFGWGLILAELIPDRAAFLVTRGRAFGDSRRICNAHWLSDTEEGRIAAAATVARLHAEPAFRADLEAARAELGGTLPQPRECAREEAALASTR
ncbi:MAG: phosphatase PAP2 family protein [Novosphingobium sp.]